MRDDLRPAVEACAMSWLHTPYHSGARIKGVGVDCAQLLCAVYHEAGVLPDIDPGYYPPDWHLHRSEERYIEWMDRYGERIRPEEAKVGDAVLFRFGRTYSHSAIVCSDGLLVHAYLLRGVIVSRITEEPLEGRQALYWTIK